MRVSSSFDCHSKICPLPLCGECVCVGGVLKQAIDLSTQLRNEVVAFCEALASCKKTDDEAMHSTIAAMHSLSAEIARTERTLSIAELKAILAPAIELHATAPFVKRLQTWPRGYPGDFETIEDLVDCCPKLSSDHPAYWIEWYALNSAVGQQHRNKIRFQADQIRSVLGGNNEEPRYVASVGCGGARDFALVTDALKTAHVTLIDIDEQALKLAVSRVKTAASVDAIQGDALRALRSSKTSFDLLLFGGLFDYLPDRYVVSTLGMAIRKLRDSNNRLVFTNIRKGNPFRPWLSYVADWQMIERSEDELYSLCAQAGLDEGRLSVNTDPTGLALLAVVG